MEIKGLGIFVAMAAPTITCGVSSTVYYDILASETMSNVILVALLVFLSLFFYLFFLWKYLRDDYDTNKVFTFGFTTFISCVAALIIASLIVNFWFYVGIVVYGFITFLLFRKFGFRFFELLEAATPGYLFFLSTMYLRGVINNGESWNYALLVISLVVLLLFFVIKKHYKKFNWYKSGRLGFASMFSLGTIFFARSVSEVVAEGAISNIGVVGFIPSAILSFLAFFSLYNLNEG